MNRLFPVLVLATLSGTPSHAQSFGEVKGTLRFQYYAGADDITETHLEGSLGTTFGNVIAQVDVARWAYDSGIDYDGFGLHFGYQASDQLALGAFFAEDHWEATYRHAGLEAVYDITTRNGMPVRLEGFVGRYTGPSYEISTAALDTSFGLGQGFSATGGVTLSRGDDIYSILSLGGSYQINDVQIDVGIHRFIAESEQTVVGLGLTYSFGGGEVFKPRKWTDMFPNE
jgi:hypothetical protein